MKKLFKLKNINQIIKTIKQTQKKNLIFIILHISNIFNKKVFRLNSITN